MTGPRRLRIHGAARRYTARLQAAALLVVTALVDRGPNAVRFGKGKAVRSKLFSRPLRSVRLEASDRISLKVDSHDRAQSIAADSPQIGVLLVTKTLGIGGVEAVVATLARGLGRKGLRTAVLCEHGGATADALRARGVTVVEANDRSSALTFLDTLWTADVAQLHNAPDHLIEACTEFGLPLVPVIHTTDINMTADRWAREAEIADRSRLVIAVSETVRGFYVAHLPHPTRTPVEVIPNGVAPSTVSGADAAVARTRLGSAIGARLDEAVIFSCLARYDMQKNIPGLVSAFLDAAARRPDLRLVVAGPVEDWLEHALSNALSRGHVAGDRIHLLGASSSTTILAASDAFIVDSFFEGWPVAATEALMSGLPMVISEVGGAQELLGAGHDRGHLVPNPAGPVNTISLDLIRRARLATAHQSNRRALIEAILAVSGEIDRWRTRRPELAAQARSHLGAAAMVDAHALALCDVAARLEPSR